MATLYILYGSATGNAEYIAKDLASRTPPAPFTSVHCDALEKFKKCSEVWSKPPSPESGLRKHGVLVVCSTTGNGDSPENASRFARYIKRNTTIEKKEMQHVAYAVLGLGDTNYDIFCGAGKNIDRKMEEAGGERIKAIACADEATGLEEVVEPWKDTILGDITNGCKAKGGEAAQPPAAAEKKESAPAPAPAKAVAATPAKKKTLNRNLKSETPLYILYGSATGNAESIAKDLAATYNIFLNNPDAFTYFPSVICCDLNSWRKQCLPTWEKELSAPGAKHGVVIVASTTGNAEPPDNAERFARWIKRKQTVAAVPLKHCSYAVLGLGDTNYDVFCATGKAIDKQLEILGATRAKPLACADEGTGLEATVDPWVASILLDISLACQPDDAEEAKEEPAKEEPKPAPAPVPTAPKPVTPEKGEEKKMEVGDAAPTTTGPASSGVRTLCNILKLDCNCPLDEVDRNCLPKIGTSLSSCQLLTQLEQEAEQLAASTSEDDRVTVSSASSTNIHYNLAKPFESCIRNARYLTNTPTGAAQKAADLLKTDISKLQPSLDAYTEAFPLVPIPTANEDAVERNGKRVIELTLALPDDFTLEYNPGDSLGLIVENPPSAVDFVLGMLEKNQGVLANQHVKIDNEKAITVREAICRTADFSSPLKNKRILSSLAQHATNCEDRKALQLLASKTPQGEKAFEQFVDQQRLSVVDILKEFPSCQVIPLTALLSILPGIPPRYYSVSSSPLVRQQDLTLTVSFSVVDYVTPSLKFGEEEVGLRRKKGIATSYLEALSSPFLAGGKEGVPTCIKIFPKPSADFRMPSTLATPMILVGPGTGIAPFMGFLQHRRAMLSQTESKEAASSVVEGTWRGGYEMEEEELKIGKSDASGLNIGADFISKNMEGNFGSVDVFFGCRHENHDWLYKEDMQLMKDQGVISSLHTAFSRDAAGKAKNGSRRKYVQDLMLKDDECAARLQSLILEKNAAVYICGDGNAMAKDVQCALTEIIGKASGGEEGGKKYVEKMKEEKRYLVDIWTS